MFERPVIDDCPAEAHGSLWPYCQLVAGVIDCARLDMGAPAGNPERQDAVRWLLRETDGPFSFIWCCNILGLDPAKTRQAIIDVEQAPGNRPRRRP